MFTITTMARARRTGMLFLVMAGLLLQACSTTHHDRFRDPNMDFGSLRTVAILPLTNLSKDQQGSERVRDVLTTLLLATEAMYVVPPGEVARGIVSANVASVTAPSPDEVVRLAKIIKVDAIMTGTLREYGEVRSGSAMANVISLSMQLMETQTGKVVWSASSTQGGIGLSDRLFGGGGVPLDRITEKAADEIITKLFD